MMSVYLIPFLFLLSLVSIPALQSDTNHFGAEGVFELDLGDSEIPLTQKQERLEELIEEKLHKKRNFSLRNQSNVLLSFLEHLNTGL